MPKLKWHPFLYLYCHVLSFYIKPQLPNDLVWIVLLHPRRQGGSYVKIDKFI